MNVLTSIAILAKTVVVGRLSYLTRELGEPNTVSFFSQPNSSWWPSLSFFENSMVLNLVAFTPLLLEWSYVYSPSYSLLVTIIVL